MIPVTACTLEVLNTTSEKSVLGLQKISLRGLGTSLSYRLSKGKYGEVPFRFALWTLNPAISNLSAISVL